METIISILGLLLGGGGIGGWLTFRYTRRKERAEADMVVQDVYQQLINDVKADRDEQRAYIGELKEDRKHLREERDELRERIDKTDETVRQLQREVARNGRMVEGLRPFMCGLLGCKDRKPVTISADGEVKPKRITKAKPQSMEPENPDPLKGSELKFSVDSANFSNGI